MQNTPPLHMVVTGVEFAPRNGTKTRATLTFTTREGTVVNLYLGNDSEAQLRGELTRKPTTTPTREWDFASGTRYFITGGVDMFHVHDHNQDPSPRGGRLGCSYRVPTVGRTYRTYRAAANAAAKLEAQS